MKNKLLYLCFLWPALLQAAPELALSGRAFSDLYLPTNEAMGKAFQQLNTSLWLQGDGKFSESFSARAIYQGDGFEGSDSRLTGDRPGTHIHHRLREGYLEYFQSGWQLRAGKQLIPWGKSDGINSTDFLSAKDSSFLNHDSEVTRVGGLSILAGWTPNLGGSPWNYMLVISPIFPESGYLIPPAALPRGITLQETTVPERNLENTELAAKTSYSGEGWDASLSFFHGWNHQPELTVVSHQLVSPGDLRILLGREFHRINALGADASYSAGDWVHRLETAYTSTANQDGSHPLNTPSHWDAVLGTERPIGESFRVHGQVIGRLFPRYTSPADARGENAVSALINKQVAAANALLQQYQEKWNSAATLRAAYSHEPLGFTAEILYYWSFSGHDYYLRPLVSYALLDSVKAYLGGDFYGGPSERSVGSLKTFNAVFTEIKYTF